MAHAPSSPFVLNFPKDGVPSVASAGTTTEGRRVILQTLPPHPAASDGYTERHILPAWGASHVCSPLCMPEDAAGDTLYVGEGLGRDGQVLVRVLWFKPSLADQMGGLQEGTFARALDEVVALSSN